MLLYYPFWMFMGFTIHFYIIFGTNLLTGGPTQIAVFLPLSVFRRKGISNVFQTEWNLQERSFWKKRNPGDLEWTSRSSRGGHEAGGRTLGGWVHPPHLWAPRGSPDRPPSPIYTCIPWKHRGAPRNPISTATTFCTCEIPYWGLFLLSGKGGFDHGGLLHQHHSVFDDVWVVYLRPSGP